MHVASKLRNLLDVHHVPYRIYSHLHTRSLNIAAEQLGITRSQILQCHILTDDENKLLMIYPLDAKIDFIKLKKKFNSYYRLLPDFKVNRIFDDCEPYCHPPFGEPYRLNIVIDYSVMRFDKIYCCAGCATSLVEISVDDLLYLNGRASLVDFIQHEQSQPDNFACGNQLELQNMFPTLPDFAKQLLDAKQENLSQEEFCKLVSSDQQLIASMQQFISKPNQRFPHVAFAISASRQFTTSNSNLQSNWLHAICCGLLAEKLAVYLEYNIDPVKCYLGGFMHNFGLILLSQLFPPEFNLLQKMLTKDPKSSILVHEKKLLGMGKALHVFRHGHCSLGEQLLRFWSMPEELCTIALEHHNYNYADKYADYVKIVQLANILLKEFNIGDNVSGEISSLSLNLSSSQIQHCIELAKHVVTDSDILDNIAKKLSN